MASNRVPNRRKKTKKNSNVVSFEKAKKKRNKKNYKSFLLTIIVISFLIYIALFTTVFNITNIKIFGNEKFSSENIINFSGLTYGQNIFKANYFEIKNNLLKNQYIKDVKISRSYPGTVKITIIERKPAAYFKYLENDFIIIDNEGIVLDKLQSVDQFKIPSIEGIEFEKYIYGNILTVDSKDADKFDTILECINAGIKYGLNDDIGKIDISNKDFITAFSSDGIYQINLIDKNEIDYKYKFLQNILDSEEEKFIEYVIDFTLPSKPSINPKY